MDTKKPEGPSPEEAPISDDAQFDSLMAVIGNDGYFQKRFNVIFNFALIIVMSMTYLNLLMALSVPEHHCLVPGMNYTDYTLSEWQARMLPKEINPETDIEGPSTCKMYKIDDFGNPITNITQACKYGMDYDKAWYTLTAASQQDWVCENELYVANVYAVSRIGEVVGALVLGPMADWIGRKPVYYISLLMVVVGRMLTTFTASYYEWFLFLAGISSTASTIIFQTPLVIGMEVSDEKGRAHLALVQCVGWTVGICLLPLLTWWAGDWRLMLAVTTLPSTVAFALYRLIPESPRWLASRGKTEQAMRVLDYIAKVNSKKLPENTLQVIQAIGKTKEKTFGIASLLANARLARNSILLNLCWMSSGLLYFCLTLNATNMAGNPFMNFFWQALVELPGYIVAQYVCDRIGRRWTNAGSFGVAVAFSILLIATYGSPWWVSTLLVCLIKMGQSGTYYAALLQSMEVYPTCIRQTGSSVGGLAMNIIGILGAYIVFWGQTEDARIPYVAMLVMAAIGLISAALLPETLNKKLPETLEDAKTFGDDQKFWSFNITQISRV